MNRFQVRKVAVLGAGVMGAQIAAHLVNCRVPVVLFDLAAREGPKNGIVAKAVEGLKKLKPSPLGVPEDAALIQQANYEEHLALLGEPLERPAQRIASAGYAVMLTIAPRGTDNAHREEVVRPVRVTRSTSLAGCPTRGERASQGSPTLDPWRSRRRLETQADSPPSRWPHIPPQRLRSPPPHGRLGTQSRPVPLLGSRSCRTA